MSRKETVGMKGHLSPYDVKEQDTKPSPGDHRLGEPLDQSSVSLVISVRDSLNLAKSRCSKTF